MSCRGANPSGNTSVAFTSGNFMQVYAATRGQEPLRVYNLRYKDSFEQDKYAASLRREQSIFEELIRAKGRMVLPDLQQARLVHETPFKRHKP